MLKFRELTLVTLTTLIAIAIFFRTQIISGFELQFGDQRDGMIEVSLLQHWFNVFHRSEAWNVVNYFYPHGDTLGYNDGYFLYGVIFTLSRAFGADPLLASELVNVVIRAGGAFGMFALLAGPVGCRFGWSLTGALLFSIANNSLVQAGHVQLLMVSFAPVTGLFLWRLAESFVAERPTDIMRWGALFAIFLAVWFLTSYYTAWFFSYFLVVLAIVALLMLGRSGRSRVAARLRRNWQPVALVIVMQIVMLLPFLYVYLPKMRESGGYGWHTPRFYSPNPIDVINVGSDNLLWGRLYTALRSLVMPRLVDGELQSGITPIVFLVGLTAAMIVVFRHRAERHLQAIRWIAIAMLISWLMTIRFGEFSIWRYVKPVLPGSRGVRVVARYQLFVMAPMTVLVIWWLDRWRGIKARAIAAAIGLVMLAEQLNSAPPTSLDRYAQLAMLADIPAIPRSCHSFYVVQARRVPYAVSSAQDRLYPHNVDAMTIAEMRGVPTVNGFSTFNPPDWNSFASSMPDYGGRMRAYASAHGLHGVCSLDLTHNGWTMAIR